MVYLKYIQIRFNSQFEENRPFRPIDMLPAAEAVDDLLLVYPRERAWCGYLRGPKEGQDIGIFHGNL